MSKDKRIKKLKEKLRTHKARLQMHTWKNPLSELPDTDGYVLVRYIHDLRGEVIEEGYYFASSRIFDATTQDFPKVLAWCYLPEEIDLNQ